MILCPIPYVYWLALVQYLLTSEQDIQDSTRIDEKELKRHLQSLACAKFKILKKHPPGRDVAATDMFSFNSDFSSSMKKLKIGTISSKVENTAERRETELRIGEERRYQMEVRNPLAGIPGFIQVEFVVLLQACIVRVMKDRKHMKHTDLVHEVTAQLSTKFVPDTSAVKQRIEYLIEVRRLFILVQIPCSQLTFASVEGIS